jgi:hypothetical protein
MTSIYEMYGREINNRLLAGALCFVVFLMFYGLTSRSDLQLTDEVAVFISAISLETQGDLAIDELQWLNDEINIGGAGKDGHLYSKYFPGNVITTAIAYKLAKRQVDQPYLWSVPKDLNPALGFMKLAPSNMGARSALKINAVFGALAMTALFLLLMRYFNWKTTITTVILVGVCTNWWYQSRGFLSEVGAGAFLITSLCFTAYRKPYHSGFALGLSLLFRPTNIIAFPVWGKAVWDKGKSAAWSVFALIIGMLGLALFNWIRFGSIFDFGYGEESFVKNLFDGLYGILLSPGRSLFLYSPILTLAIPGAWSFYKKEKSLTVISVLAVLSYVFMAASWHSWDGGWSWGSRLLTPIIPILGFLTAPSVEYAWGKRGDIFVIIVLSLLGFGIQIIALAKNPIETLVNFVVFGDVSYNETINTVNNSWLVLQLRSLKDWQICNLDAYTIRQWFGICR